MNNKLLKNLIVHILNLKNEKEVYEFLDSILTSKEMEEIPMRIEIVKMLLQGIPHHEIAAKLGVGIATVTRGSKEISNGKFKFLMK